jgi:hypothetical protein
MAHMHASKQVKILSLTLRILLVSRRITQKDLVRAAKIAAADVRAQRPLEPIAPIRLNEEIAPKGEGRVI